jgi:CHASE2 domain-containing sensor protein
MNALSKDVVVVNFDDAAVREFRKFPIPRDVVAQVIRKVAPGNPELIGLDMLLTEARDPFRTRPGRRRWPMPGT